MVLGRLAVSRLELTYYSAYIITLVPTIITPVQLAKSLFKPGFPYAYTSRRQNRYILTKCDGSELRGDVC
jgi:hypothetical protein